MKASKHTERTFWISFYSQAFLGKICRGHAANLSLYLFIGEEICSSILPRREKTLRGAPLTLSHPTYSELFYMWKHAPLPNFFILVILWDSLLKNSGLCFLYQGLSPLEEGHTKENQGSIPYCILFPPSPPPPKTDSKMSLMRVYNRYSLSDP